ncbi:DUF4147 domain-containing protein [soil metagenome]
MNNPVDDAIAIWKAGVAAVEPKKLVVDCLTAMLNRDELPFQKNCRDAKRILVVGAGKAGAAMSVGVESALSEFRNRIVGVVNVPAGAEPKTDLIRLNSARPAASNFPTSDGVCGAVEMLELFASAGPSDVGIALISGGGSALLPAPVDGVTLDEKLIVTRLLHASGATISELNCVRKHLSKIKGGQLAQAFRGKLLVTLIISDVVGDPLDVIASGPTVPDPTTYSDAKSFLVRYHLENQCPDKVIEHLEKGMNGSLLETLKSPLGNTQNLIVGSNEVSRIAAFESSEMVPYHLSERTDLYTGEAAIAAKMYARRVRGPHRRPKAFLFGGETTVTLGNNPGKGGRNQEFVLAMLCELGEAGMNGVTILSGGTDGEDGPTDAAGAIGTLETLQRAKSLGLNPRDYLDRHDAYPFFEATGSLFKTGLTGTNVMDLGVILLR